LGKTESWVSGSPAPARLELETNVIKFKKPKSNDLAAAKKGASGIADIQNNFFEWAYELRNIADAEDALEDHQGE
jgi:hypothetical protein